MKKLTKTLLLATLGLTAISVVNAKPWTTSLDIKNTTNQPLFIKVSIDMGDNVQFNGQDMSDGSIAECDLNSPCHLSYKTWDNGTFIYNLSYSETSACFYDQSWLKPADLCVNGGTRFWEGTPTDLFQVIQVPYSTPSQPIQQSVKVTHPNNSVVEVSPK